MTDALPAVRKAAAYGRISEDNQDKREGVDEQLSRAESHAERRGWDLVGSWRDDDLSAYSGKPRPGDADDRPSASHSARASGWRRWPPR
jgi:hypothetical protein